MWQGLKFKGPATRNDFVNDIVNDARADAIFATLKAIVDDDIVDDIVTCGMAFPLCYIIFLSETTDSRG